MFHIRQVENDRLERISIARPLAVKKEVLTVPYIFIQALIDLRLDLRLGELGFNSTMSALEKSDEWQKTLHIFEKLPGLLTV